MSSAISQTDNPGRALNDRQRTFADLWAKAKAEGLDCTHADLAKAAGYTGNDDSLKVAASRCLASPAVREYLITKAREYLRDGAMDVAITLRALTRGARSERVRADTAARLAAGLGLIDQEHGERGPGVAIQIVFKTDAGALLAQPPRAVPNVQIDQRPAQVEHALAEGAGESKAPARRSKRTPPGGRPEAAETHPASKTGATLSPPGKARNAAPKKSRGKS